MKQDSQNQDDEHLRRALQQWKPEPTLPPGFQSQVWRRIERAEATKEPAVSLVRWVHDWLTSKLPRPALTAGYVAVLLLGGAAIGWNDARRETTRVSAELGARYVGVVDPFRQNLQP